MDTFVCTVRDGWRQSQVTWEGTNTPQGPSVAVW